MQQDPPVRCSPPPAVPKVEEVRRIIDSDLFQTLRQRHNLTYMCLSPFLTSTTTIPELDALQPLLSAHDALSQPPGQGLLRELATDPRYVAALLAAHPTRMVPPSNKPLTQKVAQLWKIVDAVARSSALDIDGEVFAVIMMGIVRLVRQGVEEVMRLQIPPLTAEEQQRQHHQHQHQKLRQQQQQQQQDRDNDAATTSSSGRPSGGSSSSGGAGGNFDAASASGKNDKRTANEDDDDDVTIVSSTCLLSAQNNDNNKNEIDQQCQEQGILSSQYARTVALDDSNSGNSTAIHNIAALQRLQKRINDVLLARLPALAKIPLDFIRHYKTNLLQQCNASSSSAAAAANHGGDEEQVSRRAATFSALVAAVSSALHRCLVAVDAMLASTNEVTVIFSAVAEAANEAAAAAAAAQQNSELDQQQQEQQQQIAINVAAAAAQAKAVFLEQVVFTKRKLVTEFTKKVIPRLEAGLTVLGGISAAINNSIRGGARKQVIPLSLKLSAASSAWTNNRGAGSAVPSFSISSSNIATPRELADHIIGFAGDNHSGAAAAAAGADFSSSDLSAKMRCALALLRDAGSALLVAATSAQGGENHHQDTLSITTHNSNNNNNNKNGNSNHSDSAFFLIRALLEMLPGFPSWSAPLVGEERLNSDSNNLAAAATPSATRAIFPFPNHSEGCLAECFSSSATLRDPPSFTPNSNTPGSNSDGASPTTTAEQYDSVASGVGFVVAEYSCANKWIATATKCLAAVLELVAAVTSSSSSNLKDGVTDAAAAAAAAATSSSRRAADAFLDEVGSYLIAALSGCGWHSRVNAVAAQQVSHLWLIAFRSMCPGDNGASGEFVDASDMFGAWLQGLGTACCEGAKAESLARQEEEENRKTDQDQQQQQRPSSSCHHHHRALVVTSNLFTWAATVFLAVSQMNPCLYCCVVSALWEEHALGRQNQKNNKNTFSNAESQLPLPDVLHFLASITTDACMDETASLGAAKFWRRLQDLLSAPPLSPSSNRMPAVSAGGHSGAASIAELLIASVAAVTPSSKLARFAFFESAAVKTLHRSYWSNNNNNNNNNHPSAVVQPTMLLARTYPEQAAMWSAAAVTLRNMMLSSENNSSSGSAKKLHGNSVGRNNRNVDDEATRFLIGSLVPFARDVLLCDARLEALQQQQQQVLRDSGTNRRGDDDGDGDGAENGKQQQQEEQHEEVVLRIMTGLCALLQILTERLGDFSASSSTSPAHPMLLLHQTVFRFTCNFFQVIEPTQQQQQQQEQQGGGGSASARCDAYIALQNPINLCASLISTHLFIYLYKLEEEGNAAAEALGRSAAVMQDTDLPMLMNSSLFPASEFIAVHGQLALAAGNRVFEDDGDANDDADGDRNISRVVRVARLTSSKNNRSSGGSSAAQSRATRLQQQRVDAFLAASEELLRNAPANSSEQHIQAVRQVLAKMSSMFGQT